MRDPVTDVDAYIHERTRTPRARSTSEEPSWTGKNFEIDEVTIDVSLSMGISSTTESIALLNPRKNLEKYKHSCQVRDLNPGGQEFGELGAWEH